jgi:branched-chain amino acid aminotransferase
MLPTLYSLVFRSSRPRRHAIVKMSLSDCKFIWKNGKIVPWAEATVHISCHGLHYGTGVFEGIRCYNTTSGPAVFRLAAHIDRWFVSARVYGLVWPHSRPDFSRAVLDVIRANDFHECYVRLIAFYGSHTLRINPRGCPTELAILAWHSETFMDANAQGSGLDVCISPWRRFSNHAIPARTKACGQYLNSVLASQDAALRRFSEALLLDDAGNLSGGPDQNLFLVRKNQLFTNDQGSGVLLGIARDTVIHLANDLGIGTYIQKFKLKDLREADEAFLTSTATEITPIASVDMHVIGKGNRGPVTAQLQDAYKKASSGRIARYNDWLTRVTPH